MKSLRAVCYALVIFLAFQPQSNAETIELTTAKGHIATAEYLPGEEGMSAVLILHGFLQTREFSTVERLALTLNDAGYTVLSPNLTLGISRRNRSLDCEAVHTHSLDQDVAELEQWIKWLNEKSASPVNIIGHSAAGSVILSYLLTNQQSQHSKTILISLSHYASGPEASEKPEHAKMARAALKNEPTKIQTYALNYCKTYPSYPAAFLSYYEWDTDRTKDAISRLKKPISIIIGSSDRRLDKSWRNYLMSIKDYVTTIDGANHFFDQTHEFDLHDAIESILSE